MKQTDLVLDYHFPRIKTCECDVKCPVILEGKITCCKDCIKFNDLCHSVCSKLDSI